VAGEITAKGSPVQHCGNHIFRKGDLPAALDRASMAHARTHPPPIDRRPDECWHVYWGDIHAGTIQIRSGIPFDEDSWGWSCGFYPGSHPREHEDGTAATFDQARADFEHAWRRFLSKRTEADFQAWRDQRDWTAEICTVGCRQATSA
jgi:hypothetical protein